MAERIDIALTSHGNGSVHGEEVAFLQRPYRRRYHDARELVAAFDNQREIRVLRLIRRGVVHVSNHPCESGGERQGGKVQPVKRGRRVVLIGRLQPSRRAPKLSLFIARRIIDPRYFYR
jgi:hypothetical protein